jgi:hypothetical protein
LFALNQALKHLKDKEGTKKGPGWNRVESTAEPRLGACGINSTNTREPKMMGRNSHSPCARTPKADKL